MIPCKECITLAVCQHRNVIKCDLLGNWITDRYPKRTEIRSVLKKVEDIKYTDRCGIRTVIEFHKKFTGNYSKFGHNRGPFAK